MNSCRSLAESTVAPVADTLIAVALIPFLCGCPQAPPSQESQQEAATSRWITVEPSDPHDSGKSCLNQDDLNAITATVPTIASVVAERVRTGTIASGTAETAAQVSGTGPNYLSLLEVGARVTVQRGRFLEEVEAAEGTAVIVLSQSLADRLFQFDDPKGQSVVLEGLSLTVVGVVTDGAEWGKDVKRDAYVPLKLFGTESAKDVPFPYDRFRFRVESIDQVEQTHSIIQEIINKRHPDANVRIRSFLSDRH